MNWQTILILIVFAFLIGSMQANPWSFYHGSRIVLAFVAGGLAGYVFAKVEK